ncbi:MAG: hypothetical protein RL148_2052 [Planctomycetota bacterium]|jgi:hypothetical protein
MISARTIDSRAVTAIALSVLLFSNSLSATSSSHAPAHALDARSAADAGVLGWDDAGLAVAGAEQALGRGRAYPKSLILLASGTDAVSRTRPGGGGGGGGGGNGGGNGGGRPGRL